MCNCKGAKDVTYFVELKVVKLDVIVLNKSKRGLNKGAAEIVKKSMMEFNIIIKKKLTKLRDVKTNKMIEMY